MKLAIPIFFLLALVLSISSKGQEAGKAEYERGVALIAKNKHKQANKLIEEACNKGFMPACRELRFMWYASDNQRAEARKKLMESGDRETIFGYAQSLPPDSFSRKVQLLTKLGEGGYKEASLLLGDLYAGNTSIHDTAIAVRIYRYWAALSDTVAWAKMVLLQNNDANALYYLGYVIQNNKGLNSKAADAHIFCTSLYEAASRLGDGRASYQLGAMQFDALANYDADIAHKYYELAAKQGFKVPESDLKYVAWLRSPEGRKAHAENVDREAKLKADSRYQPEPSNVKPSVTGVTRKTCPVCNGTGKVTRRYTSESRNWDKGTITMTDHTETSACGRCNGKGYYEY